MFFNDKEFVKDLEWFFSLIQKSVFKRVQSPPIIVTSKSAYGYDIRESMLPYYPTQKQEELKKFILERKNEICRRKNQFTDFPTFSKFISLLIKSLKIFFNSSLIWVGILIFEIAFAPDRSSLQDAFLQVLKLAFQSFS